MKVNEFPPEEEYRKDSRVSPRDVARLRHWASTQPHLPAGHLTDLDLILIYQCTDLSSEVSKQLLDTQYTLRTHFAGLFQDRQLDDKLEQAMNTVLTAPLPTRSPEGYACLYLRFLDPTPKSFVVPDFIKALLMVMDLWQYEEGTWPGLLVIIDLYGLGVGHMARFDLQSLQQFFYFVQEGMPLKLKNIHFINAPPFTDKILALLRPLMNKRVQNLLQTHAAGSDTLYKFYPKEGLPKEAGGLYKSFAECKYETIMKLRDNAHYFELEKNKRVVESLRPGKPKTYNDFFGGIEGSFKQLEID